MLEGAKLIGAGAATIASEGAAVGSGNGFSSLINNHSVARNPSLAKQQPCLLNFGLCSNRSYCIVCSNDGHRLVDSRSRSFFSTSGSSTETKRAEFMRSFSNILVISASEAARYNPPVLFTKDDLIEAAKLIHSFSYSFCQFYLKPATSNYSNSVLMHHPAAPNLPLSFHVVNKLDALVIKTLASSLNSLFIKRKLFAHNSFLAFGEIAEVDAFSQYLKRWEGLEKILLLDFSRQLQRIKKDELFDQISPLLDECPEILFLLRVFLDQPIFNEKGETFNEPTPSPIWIPPIAQVLLNFHLRKVDEALNNIGVGVKVARIGKEVVIGIPKRGGKSAKNILEIIDYIGLIYQVRTIKDGDTFACADELLNVKLEKEGKLHVAQTFGSAAS